MPSQRKYEFVPGDEKVIGLGRVAKRIRLVVALTALGLPTGTLGGYIEHEKCLDHSGDAWVYGDAQVSGDAWVYGDAQVSGNARVYGDARVYGNARVYGDGCLFWASKVGRDNATLTVYLGKDGALIATRGCFIGTVDEFLGKSLQVHDDETHLEYRLLIEVAHSRITRYVARNPQPK